MSGIHDNLTVLEFINNVAPKIVEVSEPILKNFGIKTFTYVKLFEERMLRVSNNLGWTNYHISNHFYEMDHYQEDIIKMGDQERYISLWESNSKLTEAMHYHDIWYGISLYRRYEGYVEMCSFATTRDQPQIYNFYINNINLLERFIVYFKNKLPELINTDDEKKLIQRSNKLILDAKDLSFEDKKLSFLKDTALNKLKIEAEEFDILSRRELECLYCLSQGKTGKEIAQLLHISPRTVETYIENLKAKLNSPYKINLRGCTR